MKKIILTLIISLVCVFGLVACAKNAKPTEGLEYTDKGDYYEVSGIGTATATNIVIPKEYNGKPVTSIGDFAFYGRSALKSVIIPDSVTSIGLKSFYECSGLVSVKMGKRVKSIGAGAFSFCSALDRIIIPNGVESIDFRAFFCCSSLTSVNS